MANFSTLPWQLLGYVPEKDLSAEEAAISDLAEMYFPDFLPSQDFESEIAQINPSPRDQVEDSA